VSVTFGAPPAVEVMMASAPEAFNFGNDWRPVRAVHRQIFLAEHLAAGLFDYRPW